MYSYQHISLKSVFLVQFDDLVMLNLLFSLLTCLHSRCTLLVNAGRYIGGRFPGRSFALLDMPASGAGMDERRFGASKLSTTLKELVVGEMLCLSSSIDSFSRLSAIFRAEFRLAAGAIFGAEFRLAGAIFGAELRLAGAIFGKRVSSLVVRT